jgi:hypothetical protein
MMPYDANVLTAHGIVGKAEGFHNGSIANSTRDVAGGPLQNDIDAIWIGGVHDRGLCVS